MIKKIILSILLVVIVVFSVVLGSCGEADFVVSNLVIEPASTLAGERVFITVDVTNSGASEGIYNVILQVDGDEVASELIALAGGVDKKVTLDVTVNEPGEHEVQIAGLNGIITVVNLDEIMEKAVRAISDIHSYHFTVTLEIEMSIPEDSMSFFEGIEELP